MTMAKQPPSRLPELLAANQEALLEDWLREQRGALTARADLLSEADLRRQSSEFLGLLTGAARSANLADIGEAGWKTTLDFLGDMTRRRLAAGFTPSEAATFIFSLKQPLFSRLSAQADNDAAAVSSEIWTVTVLLDALGLYTTEVYQKARNEVIARQQQEMLELSTPVVKLWDGILALPLIGTLDSERTQVVMETLLQSIVETGSGIAIIDITGVPTVDTLVAQHLLKTLAAAKLMGAQCIISGIRPQIAQTMVHLGVAFGDVVTKASLADALVYAFRQLGLTVSDGKARA
jgi:rsbT co-antagonist protein RsbR